MPWAGEGAGDAVAGEFELILGSGLAAIACGLVEVVEQNVRNFVGDDAVELVRGHILADGHHELVAACGIDTGTKAVRSVGVVYGKFTLYVLRDPDVQTRQPPVAQAEELEVVLGE